MDKARREGIRAMIQAKEGYEKNLEGMLRTLPQRNAFRQDFVVSCIPSLDYESYFADTFLGRINPKVKQFLAPNGKGVDKKRLQKLRQSEPLIDLLFKRLDLDFFKDFANNDKGLIHGDAAQDNFGSIRGRVYLGDREIHYLQADPQFSLCYLLGTAIPDPLERQMEVIGNGKDLLSLKPQEPNDFLQCAFEERYGPITEETREAFSKYTHMYNKMDTFQSLIQIARSLRGVKGQDMLHARKVYEYAQLKTSGIFSSETLDLFSQVLRNYLDLGDEEKTREAKAILFPEYSLEETLGLKHCYRMMNGERRKETLLSKGKSLAKIAATACLIPALAFGAYNYGIRNSEFTYQKGHHPTFEEPYTYAEDAPFTLEEISLDEKVLFVSPGSNHVPSIRIGSEDPSELVFDFDGEMGDQRLDVFLGGDLLHSEYLLRKKEKQRTVSLSWPSYVPRNMTLSVRLTDFAHPPSDPLFSAEYPLFSKVELSPEREFLNCFYRSLNVNLVSDQKEISPNSTVSFILPQGINFRDYFLKELKKFNEDHPESGNLAPSVQKCLNFSIPSPIEGRITLANQMEMRLPMYGEYAPLPDHVYDSPSEEELIHRLADLQFDSGNLSFQVKRLDYESKRLGSLNAEMYLHIQKIGAFDFVQDLEFFIAETSILIMDKESFDDTVTYPPNSGVYLPARDIGRSAIPPVNAKCSMSSDAYVSLDHSSSLKIHCGYTQSKEVLSDPEFRVHIPELGYTSPLIVVPASATGERINPHFKELDLEMPQPFNNAIAPGIYTFVIETGYQVREKKNARVVTSSFLDPALEATRSFGYQAPEEYPLAAFVEGAITDPESVLCYYNLNYTESDSKGFYYCSRVLKELGDVFDYSTQIHKGRIKSADAGKRNIIIEPYCWDTPAGDEPLEQSLKWDFRDKYIVRSVLFDTNPTLFICTEDMPLNYSLEEIRHANEPSRKDFTSLRYNTESRSFWRE